MFVRWLLAPVENFFVFTNKAPAATGDLRKTQQLLNESTFRLVDILLSTFSSFIAIRIRQRFH